MVKFGVHVEAFLRENAGSNLYVVPYRDVRDEFIEIDETNQTDNKFEAEWNACLIRCRDDFDKAMTDLWELVFRGISSNHNANEIRGAAPDKAFRLYFSSAGVEKSQELLTSINSIYETTLTNAEALRKLVKKYDKLHHDQRLSLTLLPKLYASNFIVGQPTLEDGLSILRHALGKRHEEDDYDDDDDVSAESVQQQRNADRRGRQHDEVVERRKEELNWLKGLVESLQQSEVARIVAHRGFHNPRGLSDRRPLENSLQAYEAAWTNGIHLCECDIAMTKDERLVLAHDNDFSRLALDKDSPMYNCQVRDLTFRELISLPLKSGIRPPLLIDVLRSARAIGGNSQLIIEIKPGNNDAAKALARLFLRHKDLMKQCAVIMSFDLFAMHTLRNDLAVLEQPEAAASHPLGPRGHRSTMSLGNMNLLMDPSDVMAGDDFGFTPLGHTDSLDHFGVGLTLSSRHSERELVSPPADAATSSSRGTSPTAKSPSTTMNQPKPSPSPKGSLRKKSISSPPNETERKIPKLMLLTVCDTPKIPAELQVGVEELSKVEGWLQRDNGALDGVYMQFQKEMLEPEGTSALRALSTRYSVGVWGYAHKDPDDYKTFHHLVSEGNVSYVNSDLPKGFRKRGAMDLLSGTSRATSSIN